MSSSQIEEEILRALRRITRAIDLHSRKLASSFGLTGPQLVCLRALGHVEQVTPSGLAKQVSLSQSTITGIVDRLAARQLVTRERNTKDRRLVTVAITDAGRALIDQAPSPLQETLTKQLGELASSEQEQIRDTLRRIVRMMGSEQIQAAPVLSTSPAAQSPEEIRDVIETGDTDVTVVAEIAPAVEPKLPTEKKPSED